MDDGIAISSGLASYGNEGDSGSLKFSGQIVVWTDSAIDDKEKISLQQYAVDKGLKLIIRDRSYVEARIRAETPLAFISHDARDKDSFVRALAAKLSVALCPVWYDEYSLKPGDSLRESIEGGLKECKKCIVVFSKNYFQNKGWASREFSSAYMKELVERNNIMTPIWFGVSREEVYDYSPVLADRVAVLVDPENVDIEIDQVARRLVAAVSA